MKQFYPDSIIHLFSNPVSLRRNITRALLVCLPLITISANSQSVSGIITDYNGYWKSIATTVNSVKPDNSHNLLAFTYNGTTYSTGVNDAALALHGETFSANDFWSLPVGTISGTVTSNTKVGLGEKYDGVSNGSSLTPLANNMSPYLTDGIKGLDLGTCVANLPLGSMTFLVSSINASSIGDGIPDILITQVADPSGSSDRYQFTDVNGAIVGNYKDIVFTSIAPVGNWTADFYDASVNPMTLAVGFTKTDRPLRLWAADLSEFGITAANYQSVRNFQIGLSGNSDVAFVAYSNKSFAVKNVLPVMMGAFTGTNVNEKALLKWTTYTEYNSSRFVIEKRTDNNNFIAIDSVKAAGTSTSILSYSYTDNTLKTGLNYYRLKLIDIDGKTKYSSVISVTGKTADVFSVYPNPVVRDASVNVSHNKATGSETLMVYNATGILLSQQSVTKNSQQTKTNWQPAVKGLYYIVFKSETEKKTEKLVVQ
jgi:hypothetical protein